MPEAIETIRAAGVMFWMLTGDKLETAIDIAYSCHLVTNNMQLTKVANVDSVLLIIINDFNFCINIVYYDFVANVL